MRKDVSNHIMGSQSNADNRPSELSQEGTAYKGDTQRASVTKPSLQTLITWNVSKVLESDPRIDLRVAMREAQDRLENSHDVDAMISPDARNLCCAFLAWQQLGHRAADSLYDFVQKRFKEHERCKNSENLRDCITRSFANDNPDFPVMSSRNAAAQKDSLYETGNEWGGPKKMGFSSSIGLVVKLPVESQAMMHLTGPVRVPNTRSKCCAPNKPPISGTASKIDSACCLDKECMDRLASVEAETQQLRKRATLFARREAERTELLERAEMAWRDLDTGYQRRLRLAKEKEDDIERQTARLLEERNRYKELSIPMVNALKKKSELAEKEREKLTTLEQELCVKACARHELLKSDARADATLTEYQCKAAQLDRDLALKEEQEMRKHRSLAGATEAAMVLTHEAEYAQRAELSALKAQVQQASQELLEEDARHTLLKERIEEYMEEKDDMIEELEACQTKCDGRMAGLVNELNNKRDQIAKLKKKVMECSCKEPTDRSVEVKRTPSLVALCRCSPSDTILDSCSCTSLRSRLLSSLLKDLFGGLKYEMENIGSHMPCHLLKCLEDKHNWDRATDVKKNIRSYFARLLLGELDIAIAAVIEKCHAQWMGECCADFKRQPTPRNSVQSLRWQEHEIEMKTQKMASKLAEKMFLEKAQELAKQAELILSKDGHPPCECGLHEATSRSSAQYSSAVYHCLVQPPKVHNLNNVKGDLNDVPVKDHRRDKNVIHQRQFGHPKKDANGTISSTVNTLHLPDRSRKKDVKNVRPGSILKNNCAVSKYASNVRNFNANARKPDKSVVYKNNVDNKVRNNAPTKVFKGSHQYAVNMCLCGGKNNTNWKTESKTSCNQKPMSHASSIKQSKPALAFPPETSNIKDSETIKLKCCTDKNTCFHKSPSNTSVDRLIGILTKWKDNLVESQESNVKRAVNTDSLFKVTHASIVNVLQQICGKTESSQSERKLIHPTMTDKNNQSAEICEKTVKKVYDCTKTIASSHIQINQSQYMGAINLDRSNNPLCNVGNNTEDKGLTTYLPLERVHSVRCVEIQNCISVEPNTNPEKVIDSKISNKDSEPCIQFLGVTLTNKPLKESLNKVENKNDEKLLQLQRKNKKCDRTIKSDNNEQENIIAIIPKDGENYIQFLGVVLDDANISRLSKRDTIQSLSKDVLRDQKLKNDIGKTCVTRKTKYKEKRIKDLKVLHVHNKCTHNAPYREVNKLRVNKSVEVLINTNIDDIQKKACDESCICCQGLDVDNTNDLEVNTFQLLEDHLKCQLEEFKLSVCKSSCMKNADEKNLVDDTLLKVKRLILETASAVTCKCAGNTESSGGSWKRAYSLLQEYLKTKIERVKCLCDSTGQNQDDNLVPRVLSKINCLIQNDLHRLKNICKCKNATSANNHSSETHVNDFSQYKHRINSCNNLEIPNTSEQNYVKNEIVESMFSNFTNAVSNPYNKSAQVSFFHSVVTRSCDALETHNQYSEAQTVDMVEGSISVLEEHCCISLNLDKVDSEVNRKVSDHHDDKNAKEVIKDTLLFPNKEFIIMPISLSSTDIKKENVVTASELFSNEENQLSFENIDGNIINGVELLVDEEKQNNLENIDESAVSCIPYIGCTINCCCDSNLGCVCTKSAVPTNTDWWKNNNIWSTLSQNSNDTEKFSYILSHLPTNLPEEDYSEKNTVLSKINVCEFGISADEEVDIYLKKSMQKLDIVNDTSYTGDILTQNITESMKYPSKNPSNREITLVADEASQRSLSRNCDCAMVPVCHVKMLMDDISSKLVKAECTCDSLKSVCPVHFY